MKKLFAVSVMFFLIAGFGISSVSFADQVENDYPIVLVHGFLGWGRTELGGSVGKGHYYWGGYDDLQTILNNAGSRCKTATVGPVSSNWDRACELYAQIKGVETDYGLAHSLFHGHARFGRDFTNKALVPGWGEPGNNEKIHIIAHSMGGQTVHMLAQLLEKGYIDEMNSNGYSGQSKPISALFDNTQPSTNLICSITTLASTHSGTTLASGISKLIPNILDLAVGVVFPILGLDPTDKLVNIYDFKLDHWGFAPKGDDEKFNDYLDRMLLAMNGFIESNQKDICLWDLSPEGASEQNAWVNAQSNIYYFSHAGESTNPNLFPSVLDNFERHHKADYNVFSFFTVTCPIMGFYTSNDDRYHGPWRAKDGEFYRMALEDRVSIDSSWWENDGVVNTNSQKGPWLYPENYMGEKDTIVNWDGVSIPEKGVWNFGGVLKNIDHFDITGLEFLLSDWHDNDKFDHIEDWYVQKAVFLRTLP
ncbi:MAG: lipase [Desulfobacteraceae bacterium]|nr:lipase [Desulfobacteraceae bacterium]